MGDLVVACVAPADQRPDVDLLTGEVRVDDAMAALSPADTAAIEQALRAGEAWDLPVLVAAAGDETIEPVLKEVEAVGAGVLRVPGLPRRYANQGPRSCEGAELAGDALAVASALADAIRSAGTPMLVVCGDRSSLSGVGAVPAILAHLLGAAQALGLVSLSFEPGRSVVAERRLDGGWRERLRLTPPAVCSVEAAGVRLRRARLDGALEAAPARIPVAQTTARIGSRRVEVGVPAFYRPRTKAIPPPAGAPHERIVSLTGALANREPPRVVGPVGPVEAVDELLRFLSRAGVEPGD